MDIDGINLFKAFQVNAAEISSPSFVRCQYKDFKLRKRIYMKKKEKSLFYVFFRFLFCVKIKSVVFKN